MPIEQKFIHEWPEGSTPIDIDDWVRTLPENQQKEFLAAKVRQIALREKGLRNGSLVEIKDYTHVWKDEAAKEINIQSDKVWLKYFRKYINENGITFKEVNTPASN